MSPRFRARAGEPTAACLKSPDFDRTLVIDDPTKLVAKKVSDFLKESRDRFQITIVFCVDEEHAARMRQAFPEHPHFPEESGCGLSNNPFIR
jgi:type I site-specific restriction endonuclease